MPFLEDPIWYPPLNVAHYFMMLEGCTNEDDKKQKPFRKAEEMFAVSLMLLGIEKAQNRKYWLQAVGDDAQSPDVRTGTFTPPTTSAAPMFSTQDVEVVTYDENSTDSLFDFLKRTKLSPSSSYDELTTVLCRIRRGAQLPPLHELHKQLASIGSKVPVMILGKISPDQDLYKIFQVNPAIDLVVEFNLAEELRRQHTGILKLKPGSKSDNQSFPDEKHYPFEKLGFKPV